NARLSLPFCPAPVPETYIQRFPGLRRVLIAVAGSSWLTRWRHRRSLVRFETAQSALLNRSPESLCDYPASPLCFRVSNRDERCPRRGLLPGLQRRVAGTEEVSQGQSFPHELVVAVSGHQRTPLR